MPASRNAHLNRQDEPCGVNEHCAAHWHRQHHGRDGLVPVVCGEDRVCRCHPNRTQIGPDSENDCGYGEHLL